MKAMLFTEEELEELRRFDAEVDAAPMTFEDYKVADFVDELLFPETAKRRAKATERRRAYYNANRDKINAQSRVWHERNREHDAERKRAWYLANKARIAAQQKEYREKNKERIAAKQKEYRERRIATATA